MFFSAHFFFSFFSFFNIAFFFRVSIIKSIFYAPCSQTWWKKIMTICCYDALFYYFFVLWVSFLFFSFRLVQRTQFLLSRIDKSTEKKNGDAQVCKNACVWNRWSRCIMYLWMINYINFCLNTGTKCNRTMHHLNALTWFSVGPNKVHNWITTRDRTMREKTEKRKIRTIERSELAKRQDATTPEIKSATRAEHFQRKYPRHWTNYERLISTGMRMPQLNLCEDNEIGCCWCCIFSSPAAHFINHKLNQELSFRSPT